MSGSARKYDYESLERQFVQGTMSIRELARTNEIAAWSVVHAQAKKREWHRKRDEFQSIASRKEMEAVAQGRAEKLEALTDDIIDSIRAATWRFLENLQDRTITLPNGNVEVIRAQPVNASDMAKLIDKVLLLRGQPTKREEHLGLNLSADLDDPEGLGRELLRELQTAARSAGATTAAVGSSPLPIVTGPRQVN